MSKKTTRRQFLVEAGSLALLASLPPIDLPQGADPARTALIGQRLAQLDRAIAPLLEVRQFLAGALTMPPSAVDGCTWFDLEGRAGGAVDQLKSDLSEDDLLSDDLYLALTGKTATFWCVVAEIRDQGDREDIKLEIKDHKRSHPTEAAELQTMLDAAGRW